MWQILLTILLGLRPYSLDQEAAPDRSARLETVAKAIEYASSRATCQGAFTAWAECSPIYHGARIELAALLLVMAQEESGLALHVHEGRCRPHECDAAMVRGQLVHRARSLWQVHYHPAFAEEWPNLAGTATWPTNDAAWAATVVLSLGDPRRTLRTAVCNYLGAEDCRSPVVDHRLRLVWRYQAELRAALPGG
jgi:hypothetical protein